jgi:hypothetical protein
MAKPRTVIVLSPYAMMTRNIVATPAAALLAQAGDVRTVLVTRADHDARAVAALGGNIAFEPMIRPLRRTAGGRMALADLRLVLGYALFLMLSHRFNALAGFRGYRERLRQSWPLRRPAVKEGLPVLRWLQQPLPQSRRIYRALERLYWAGWLRHPRARALFDREAPDLVVLAHCQNHFVTPYVLEAIRRGIPLLGINGSWDQPTTKGPLARGIAHMLVQSRQVAQDLADFHGFDPARTTLVGWPQMDVYRDDRVAESREAFLARVGLPPGRRYVLVGTYTERLGPHEPAMCRALAAALERGAFGPDVTLWIRCHPNETEAEARFGPLARHPDVVVERSGMSNLAHLASLVRHAACVISSAGTIGLDAAAFDRPSIAVAFEDETLPYWDRPARRFDMEHYAAVMATGGIRRVADQPQLEAAIAAYLADPALDADGRARLRGDFLEPLDGRSSERLTRAILDAARHGIAPSA